MRNRGRLQVVKDVVIRGRAMVFSRIKGQMSPPRLEDWDSSRANLLRLETVRQELDQGVEEKVQAQHWLTLTCFVEQIDPAALSLTPELFTRIQEELSALRQCEPLEAYVAALDRLSNETTAASHHAEIGDVEP
jgi:hypothetical protein